MSYKNESGSSQFNNLSLSRPAESLTLNNPRLNQRGSTFSGQKQTSPHIQHKHIHEYEAERENVAPNVNLLGFSPMTLVG